MFNNVLMCGSSQNTGADIGKLRDDFVLETRSMGGGSPWKVGTLNRME